MKYRTRTYYTDSQKALMWDRWKQGWTLHQMLGIFDRTSSLKDPQQWSPKGQGCHCEQSQRAWWETSTH